MSPKTAVGKTWMLLLMSKTERLWQKPWSSKLTSEEIILKLQTLLNNKQYFSETGVHKISYLVLGNKEWTLVGLMYNKLFGVCLSKTFASTCMGDVKNVFRFPKSYSQMIASIAIIEANQLFQDIIPNVKIPNAIILNVTQ